MITSCPFCTTDTAGNHESICPYYYSSNQATGMPQGYISLNDPVKASILITPKVYEDLIKFLENMALEYTTADDLLKQLKGT